MIFDYNVLDDTEKRIYALRTLFEKQGFARYRMSKFEEYDLYSKNKNFLVSDSIITFTDTNGKLMALKPDVTLSIIKNLKDEPENLQKIYYNENVYRVVKGSSAFREIMQSGVECMGKVDAQTIGKVLSLSCKSLSLSGHKTVLVVSDLDILSAIVDQMTTDADVRNAIIHCVGEKNAHGILSIAEEQKIEKEKTDALLSLMTLCGKPEKILPKLRELQNADALSGEIAKLEEAVEAMEGDEVRNQLELDFSLVGNMKYYNGVIFKGFVEGIPGSVLSGGQYDRLMRKMGKKSGAVGFAVYLDMLERLGER